MSETTREMIPILFMYGFVFLLAPFIGFAMWMAFDGDRLREEEAEQVAASEASTKMHRADEATASAA